MKCGPLFDVCDVLVMAALVGGCAGCSAQVSNNDHSTTGGQTSTIGQSATGGGNSTSGQNTLSDAGNSEQSQCTWPAKFDIPNPPEGGCTAARALLNCEGSNGGGMSCTTNDPTQCPGPNLTPGVIYSNCVDQCNPDEYALACGGIGPGPIADPPSTCRFAMVIPAGVMYH